MEASRQNPRKHTPTTGTSQPVLGKHAEGRDSRFKVKLWNTLGMNPKNQPHTCLLENNVLLGLAVKISWVNVGIYRVFLPSGTYGF